MERRAWFFPVVSAFGYERVACALLTYRPPDPKMLWAVLRQESRKNRMISYFGDSLWRLVMRLPPNAQIPPFSRYVRTMDQPAQEQTGREILEGLKEKLRMRRAGVTK